MNTNSELLKMKHGVHLSTVDRQRRFILGTLVERKPCPNCGERANFFEAAGIEVDAIDLVKSNADEPCACPSCKRGLELIVPLVGENWRWKLIPIKVDP
jgi:hypothetical protein